jgi:hypothetical protein
VVDGETESDASRDDVAELRGERDGEPDTEGLGLGRALAESEPDALGLPDMLAEPKLVAVGAAERGADRDTVRAAERDGERTPDDDPVAARERVEFPTVALTVGDDDARADAVEPRDAEAEADSDALPLPLTDALPLDESAGDKLADCEPEPKPVGETAPVDETLALIEGESEALPLALNGAEAERVPPPARGVNEPVAERGAEGDGGGGGALPD